MNFIEQLFGIAPDGGNGMTELALFLAVALPPLVISLRRRLRRVGPQQE